MESSDVGPAHLAVKPSVLRAADDDDSRGNGAITSISVRKAKVACVTAVRGDRDPGPIWPSSSRCTRIRLPPTDWKKLVRWHRLGTRGWRGARRTAIEAVRSILRVGRGRQAAAPIIPRLVTLRLIDLETHRTVFTFVQQRLGRDRPSEGQDRRAIDSSRPRSIGRHAATLQHRPPGHRRCSAFLPGRVALAGDESSAVADLPAHPGESQAPDAPDGPVRTVSEAAQSRASQVGHTV